MQCYERGRLDCGRECRSNIGRCCSYITYYLVLAVVGETVCTIFKNDWTVKVIGSKRG
jgi:hypothetical protein